MIKTNKYIIMAAALLGLASCSQEDDFTPTGKDTPISIASVGVGDVVATRALDVVKHHPNMYVYVKSKSQPNSSKYNCELVKWNIDNDGVPTIVDLSQTTLYTGVPGDQTIYAFSPMTNIFTIFKYLLLVTRITENILWTEDIRYAYQAVNSSEPLELNFKHLCSRVTINISGEYGTELEYANSVDIETVTLTNLLEKLNIDDSGVENPLVLPENPAYDGEQITWYSCDDADGNHQYQGIVLPTAGQRDVGIRIELTVGNETRYFATTFQPCRKDDDGRIINYGFEAGYHYTVNLKVGKDKIEVTSVDTGESSPWGTGWENETELN